LRTPAYWANWIWKRSRPRNRKVNKIMKEDTDIATVGQIEQAILLLRGQKVMLDRNLAALYGVETKI